jgi:hypothetical protein
VDAPFGPSSPAMIVLMKSNTARVCRRHWNGSKSKIPFGDTTGADHAPLLRIGITASGRGSWRCPRTVIAPRFSVPFSSKGQWRSTATNEPNKAHDHGAMLLTHTTRRTRCTWKQVVLLQSAKLMKWGPTAGQCVCYNPRLADKQVALG